MEGEIKANWRTHETRTVPRHPNNKLCVATHSGRIQHTWTWSPSYPQIFREGGVAVNSFFRIRCWKCSLLFIRITQKNISCWRVHIRQIVDNCFDIKSHSKGNRNSRKLISMPDLNHLIASTDRAVFQFRFFKGQ